MTVSSPNLGRPDSSNELSAELGAVHQKELDTLWNSPGAAQSTICPVCGRRPATRGDEGGKLCVACQGRRRRHWTFRDTDAGTHNDTPFLREIARGPEDNRRTSRLAAVVARFGLDRWLGGEHIRTLFVTELDGLRRECERLGEIPAFANEESDHKGLVTPPESFDELADRIDAISGALSTKQADVPEKVKHSAFLFGRRAVWSEQAGRSVTPFPQSCAELESAAGAIGWPAAQFEGYRLPSGAPEPYPLAQRVCAKTPTPSSVLDAWMTPRDFFKRVGSAVREEVGEATRWEVETDVSKTNWAPTPRLSYSGILFVGADSDSSPASRAVPVEIVWD